MSRTVHARVPRGFTFLRSEYWKHFGPHPRDQREAHRSERRHGREVVRAEVDAIEDDGLAEALWPWWQEPDATSDDLAEAS